jgi:hypothetical protein
MKISLDRGKVDKYISEKFQLSDHIILSTEFKCQFLFLAESGLLFEYYIINAVKRIANGNKENDQYKKDSQFSGDLLKGIWKKHYFQPEYEYANLKSELKNPRSFTSNEISRLFETHNGEPFESIRPQITHLFSREAMQHRYEKKSVTGEWILYTEFNGITYVLAFANHKEGKNQKETDQNIRRRLDNTCFKEFPFLKENLFPDNL